MTRELVDRMRTCAAALAAGSGHTTMAIMDAARLLTEAAEALDVPEPIGEPMVLLEPQPAPPPPVTPEDVFRASLLATWGGDLPPGQPRPCPSCGAVGARTVRRAGRKLVLTCPACGNNWEYR